MTNPDRSQQPARAWWEDADDAEAEIEAEDSTYIDHEDYANDAEAEQPDLSSLTEDYETGADEMRAAWSPEGRAYAEQLDQAFAERRHAAGPQPVRPQPIPAAPQAPAGSNGAPTFTRAMTFGALTGLAVLVMFFVHPFGLPPIVAHLVAQAPLFALAGLVMTGVAGLRAALARFASDGGEGAADVVAFVERHGPRAAQAVAGLAVVLAALDFVFGMISRFVSGLPIGEITAGAGALVIGFFVLKFWLKSRAETKRQAEIQAAVNAQLAQMGYGPQAGFPMGGGYGAPTGAWSQPQAYGPHAGYPAPGYGAPYAQPQLFACPRCGGGVFAGAPACQHCGQPFAPAAPTPGYPMGGYAQAQPESMKRKAAKMAGKGAAALAKDLFDIAGGNHLGGGKKGGRR